MSNEPNMSYDPNEGGVSTMPPATSSSSSTSSGSTWFPPEGGMRIPEGGMCTPEGGDGGQNMSYNTPDGKPPATSSSSSTSSGSTWFPPEGGMCTPEGGDGGQNMSYNTPDGKPPVSVWGYSSSFFGDGGMCMSDGSGGQTREAFGGMCVDTSIDPHALSCFANGGFLNVLLTGPSGDAVDGMVEVAPDTVAVLEWAAFTASLVVINGQRMSEHGTMEIPFDRELCDAGEAVKTIAIVAEFPGHAQESKVVRVKMVRDFLGDGDEVKFTIPLLKYKDMLKSKATVGLAGCSSDFTVEDAKLQLEILGRASGKTTANVVGGMEISQHIQSQFTGAISRSFNITKDFQFKVTPKLKIGQSNRDVIYNSDPNDPKKEGYRWEVKFSVEYSFALKLTKEHAISFGFEIGLTVVQLNLLKTGWEEPKWGLLEGSVAGGWNGRIMGEDYKFDGSVKLVGGLTLKPNWPKILGELKNTFAVEFAELGVLVIPFAIVVGGVAAIAINVSILIDIYQLRKMREETIPLLTNETTRGYMDGLRGIGGGAPKTTIADVASAYSAGLAEGANRRELVINGHCEKKIQVFEKWLKGNSAEVESEVKKQTKDRLRKEMWANRAEGYKKTWLASLTGSYSNGMVIRDQRNAWANIVSEWSPVQMGGDWLDLWVRHRAEYPDEPELYRGNFWAPKK